MKKALFFSLVTASILGIFKFLSVIPFNRMADDDFAYANLVINNGFWQAQKIWYTTWTGKFASTFFQSIAQFTVFPGGRVIILPLISFLLLAFAFCIFFSRFLKQKFYNFNVVLLSALSVVSLFLITPNKAESWYWLSGSVIYLWPLAFFLIGISAIFLAKTLKKDYLISMTLIFAASAGNEEIGLLINLILFSLLTYYVLTKKSYSLILSMFGASVISYAIVFFAPGNAIRGAGGGADQMNWFGSFIYSIQTGPFYLGSLISKSIFYVSFLTFILSFFFSVYFPGKPGESIDKLSKNIFIVLMAISVLSIFYLFPAFRALGRIPPDRSDITLAFFVLASVIFISFYLGKIFTVLKFEKNVLYSSIGFLISFLFIISSFEFISKVAMDIYIAKNYSGLYDQMTASLQASKGRSIKIARLPESGLIPPLQLQYEWIRGAVSDYFKSGTIIYNEK